ncbi:hypothetical protein TorRG33x02_243180 [Trema orientale]|uniref:Uncharacterized protein n=2 Tax=Cannabaceae TaxID=3481 RepID=A0A2P5APY7_PARAD|nr:hypothetical protein PanWU01x14_311620 [Parasponia andersonii]PON76116.1 hypothetical protein TorRG33x02_243180 [Trema orientale]
MFIEVEVRLSLARTRNDKAWPTKTALDCQFWPQLRLMGIHWVLLPFTLTCTISPAPATLVTKTRLK